MPYDDVQPVLVRFVAHRIARISGSMVDLDIAVHPNIGKKQNDYAHYSLYGGSFWPADINAIYETDQERHE